MKDALKHIDPHSMHDVETLRSVLLLVLQAMESMSKELSELKAENGKLRDEINRLKGEKGRPEFKRKDKISPGDKTGQSGEKADKRTNHKTGTTKDRLGIDQTIELKEVGQELPPDARIRYWEERVVQDVELRRNTVKYRIAVWYSPSEGSALLFQAALCAENRKIDADGELLLPLVETRGYNVVHPDPSSGMIDVICLLSIYYTSLAP